MAFEKIIVLDDEMIIRKTLQEQFRKRRYAVASASTIAEAKGLIEKDEFDVIFVDVNLPDGNGVDFLEYLSQVEHAPLAIMMTGDGSIQSAVECMRRGAFDYIVKPFDMEQMDVVLGKAESYSQLVKVNRYFAENSGESGLLLGESPAIQHLREVIKKVAATEATVLISGENGTGKKWHALGFKI